MYDMKKESEIEQLISKSLENHISDSNAATLLELCKVCPYAKENCYPCPTAAMYFEDVFINIMAEIARWN